jgi:hypothetical protein
MHSRIAAGRFVYVRGVYYAKPVHRNDPGPTTILRRDGDEFCSVNRRLRRSTPQARHTQSGRAAARRQRAA